MGLENAEFIPEMVDTNPTGTDPKSEGDDHLNLIKRCVQNSFPSFVGTQAAPVFVTYSEAELNDATLNGVDEAVLGAWTFADLDGVQKKVGYRNPSQDVTAIDFTPTQNQEGRIIRATADAITATIDALEQFTTLRIVTADTATNFILQGGTATLFWLGGQGADESGPFTVEGNSVVEIWFNSPTTAFVFGNGIAA